MHSSHILTPARGVRCLIGLWICWLTSPATRAATSRDWPMWRGNPALTGVAEGALPDQPALLWTFKTGAAVKSSAVVGEGKVFIGSNDKMVHALDFNTGLEVWTFKAGSAVLAPPLLFDNMIFVGSSDGLFFAMDAKTGKEIWRHETDGKIAGSANVVRIADAPPRVLIGSYDFKLYCLNATNGQAAWTYETGNYINGSCAVANGETVFGGSDAVLHVLSLTDGSKIKEIDAGAYIAASVALAGGRAYFGHYENEFLCVDLKAGKVAWRYHDLDFPYMAGAAVTDDKVLFGGSDKRMHCLKRDDGASLWKFATQGKIESSPVIADGKVVFGSNDGRVYIVSLAEGKQLWSYDLGRSTVSSPAVAGGNIVIGCDDGSVYCFGQKSK